jgi:superfamily II DNA helicase RecQ
VHNEQPLETIFVFMVHELKVKGFDADKCIIVCQTRKQCSLIYRMFQVALGSINFLNDSTDNENCLVQMFHAGSSDSVKTHVVKEMTKFNSHLRLLICTIAFGMGINCKGVLVYRSIHFGPSTTVDNLVQETGRLGRDGKQCFCYVLFNGLLMAHCDIKIKELVETKCCRTKFIRQLFPGDEQDSKQSGCLCCDWCSKKCTCLDHGTIPGVSFSEATVERSKSWKCFVRKDQKEELEKKLLQYRKCLLPSSTDQFIPAGST